MFGLTVKVCALADTTDLGRGCVEVLGSSNNSTIGISEVLFDVDTVNHVLVGCLIVFFSHHFGRLEGNIVTGLLVTFGVLGSHDFLDSVLEGVLN